MPGVQLMTTGRLLQLLGAKLATPLTSAPWGRR